MKKTYTFGILGCGMISVTHAEAIAQIPEAKLVGAADASYARAEEFAKKYGIRAYESYDAMLADPAVDIICICTPSRFHADNSIRALEHHKHVVLEKPMALNMEEANLVVEASEKNHCLLTVISQLRFAEDVIKIKRMMEEKAFGNIVLCHLTMKYWRPTEYFTSSDWRGRIECEGGGALMNQGIHGIDLLSYVVGMPTVLQGKVRTLYHDVTVEDTAVAVVSFENGAMGTIEASTCAYPGSPRRLYIQGDRGFVTLQERKILNLYTDTEKIDIEHLPDLTANSASVANVTDCTLHARQITNLIHAIEGKEALVLDAHEGRKAISIIQDIYRTSRQIQ